MPFVRQGIKRVPVSPVFPARAKNVCRQKLLSEQCAGGIKRSGGGNCLVVGSLLYLWFMIVIIR